MGYIDDIKFLWDVLWNPGKNSGKRITVDNVIKYYYQLAIIPFIAFVVIGVLEIAAGVMGNGSLLQGVPFVAALQPFVSSLSYTTLVFSAIITLFVAIPIGIAIDSFLYQLVGKFFLAEWKDDYHRTFLALTFSVMPAVIFYWVSLIPVVNILYYVLTPLWGLVILAIALSEQHKVSRLSAMVTIIIKSFLELLVLLLLAYSVFTAVGSVIGTLLPYFGSFAAHQGATPIVPLNGTISTLNWTV